jgi:superfamily II DNA or RNA helicase
MEAAPQARELRSYEWAPRYSTSRDDLIASFYQPAMERSAAYDRAVGFFRSSFYSVAGAATASFALRGGRIRLLCSPDLTADDARAIELGLSLRDAVDQAAQRELARILEHPLAQPAAQLLAALIAEKVLEIRFAVRHDPEGMFHDKVGIFVDSEGESVSFSGSINETWMAWHPLGNHESFEVFTSWGVERHRVIDHTEFFEGVWAGQLQGVRVYPAPEAFRAQLISLSPRREPRSFVASVATESPRPRSLFDHQLQAIENWREAGSRGILEHATGSGKTLTALHAIRDWIAEGRPALVIVPSTLLLEQWFAEAKRELSQLEPHILLAGGGNNEWRKGMLLQTYTGDGNAPRLTVATVQTACSERFIEAVRGGEHLMMVADEVHTVGSATHRDVLEIESGPRLGLSATPVRMRDPVGTAAIFDYFGAVVPPVVTIHDAIAAGRLCPYQYEVHLVRLSEDEATEYRRLSAKIGAAIASHGRPTGSDYVDHLLIQRARVIKRAAAKARRACEIVDRGYREGERWLVYCDDQTQVRTVLGLLREKKIDAFEYHTSMRGDRNATMDRFRRFGGVLVAIRCLDEGVDIPEVTHAVIVASSRNSREFIQRRGRVLRRSAGKHFAYVEDLLIEPPPVPADSSRDPFSSLAEAELARAVTFAKDASNAAIRTRLARWCLEWGVDPDELDALQDDD